MPSKLNLCPN